LVGLAVAEHGEDDFAASPGEADQGGGPDSDAWHGDQDRGKRVRIEYLLHLRGRFGAPV
jgi:hypothetical protein